MTEKSTMKRLAIWTIVLGVLACAGIVSLSEGMKYGKGSI